MSTRQSLTTVKVWDYVYDHQGRPAAGLRVTASVGFGRQVYFSSPELTDAIPQAVYATTDGNGYWEMELVPEDLCIPDGWCYHFDHFYEHWDAQVTSAVPPGGWQASDLTIQCSDSTAGEGGNPDVGLCRVAVESGDSCGFLQEKIVAGANVTVTKIGTLPNEQLRIAATAPVYQGDLNILMGDGVTPKVSGTVGYARIPFAGVIREVTLVAQEVGDLIMNIKKSSYAGFPGSLASIVAAAPPTLSAAQKSQDSTLTGWTTAVAAGDILAFSVNTASGISLATLALTIERS